MTRKLVLPCPNKGMSGVSTANKLHFVDFNDNDVSSDPSEERGSRRVLIACLQIVTKCVLTAPKRWCV